MMAVCRITASLLASNACHCHCMHWWLHCCMAMAVWLWLHSQLSLAVARLHVSFLVGSHCWWPSDALAGQILKAAQVQLAPFAAPMLRAAVAACRRSSVVVVGHRSWQPCLWWRLWQPNQMSDMVSNVLWCAVATWCKLLFGAVFGRISWRQHRCNWHHLQHRCCVLHAAVVACHRSVGPAVWYVAAWCKLLISVSCANCIESCNCCLLWGIVLCIRAPLGLIYCCTNNLSLLPTEDTFSKDTFS